MTPPLIRRGGVTHFDEARAWNVDTGHLRARWSDLGRAAGSVTVGVRRIQIEPGGWSTPAHDHGRDEEIFFVLGGEGIAWHAGATAAVGEGDCIVFLPRRGGHTLFSETGLDVLAFGPRSHDETLSFSRIGGSLVGTRFVESLPFFADGAPIQFVREAELGPPELPADAAATQRPSTIVNLAAVEARTESRPRIARSRRNLGLAAGSLTTGLQHVEVVPGKLSAPLHCHSLEEELFVILDGNGTLLLGEEEIDVRPGHVVSRPAATGVAHAFRARPEGLRYLAYGTREPGDICYYPTSQKINFGGVRVIARIEALDYWDGED